MSYDVTVTVTLQIDSDAVETVGTRTYSTKTLSMDQRWSLSSSTATLWDPTASGNVADFELLVLSSDSDVELEFTTNNGDANEELSSLRLAANVPLLLGANDSFYNHSASDAFAGTLDVIDLIRAKETAGATANVRLRLYS